MADYVEKGGLQWDADLVAFLETEALPGTGVEPDAIWAGLAAMVGAFGPKNEALLAKRQELQEKIDAWHIERKGQERDPEAYRAFLREIGYLVDAPEDPTVTPSRIDPEISSVCAPQLVVPVNNARMALNAANARWGSLYDALYSTDAMGSGPSAGSGDPDRMKAVVAWAKAHLDKVCPLKKGSWAEVSTMAPGGGGKLMIIAGKHATELADPSQFAGFNRDDRKVLTDVFLRANGLHIALFIDREDPVGAADPAGICDIFLEAAVSTIMDFEDSVAAVDAADKIGAYRNWLGLMKGDLTEEVGTGEEAYIRELNPDIGFTAPENRPVLLKGRSLMLCRNVDLLLKTDAVKDPQGNPIPEGLLDALITVLCGTHDFRRDIADADDKALNSQNRAIYLVKPKLHGPEEVAFTCDVLQAVEQTLGLAEGTVKLGLMDEERRTSVNLAACIKAADTRIAFVNTGFLDRTADEIFTSTEAGPTLPKAQMKSAAWYQAYERRNVDTALQAGLKGRAQIGKGMWTKPDAMAEMLATKSEHLEAGGTCAWVPSPTAAVLHATQYHQRDVFDVLWKINDDSKGTIRDRLDVLLDYPVLADDLSAEDIAAELESNCQAILGYVVRWVDQGIGCSKVPVISDTNLMEDRATLRISSQILANWLHHGIVTEDQVTEALKKMAALVDSQNAADPAYHPMAPACDGPAFQAASDLIFQGRAQPSGYTQLILQARRQEAKAL